MKIVNSIEELIGNTPLLRANKLKQTLNLKGNLLLKMECFNPMCSIKDRTSYSMLQDAIKKGRINKSTVIIEATSGNTGIALAYLCVVKNIKLILVMPENMSIERRKILSFFNAQIVLTNKSEGMSGAILKANELNKSIPNSIMLNQFNNLSNTQIHKDTTAQEILKATKGHISAFVAGVGTGGTIAGVGAVLKNKNPNTKIVAVEPSASAVLSGNNSGTHQIQGIGAGFVPPLFNKQIVDEIITVSDEDAITTSKLLATIEGIFVGISSGASTYAAITLAKKKEMTNKNIVAILPDGAERYLSTILFE